MYRTIQPSIYIYIYISRVSSQTSFISPAKAIRWRPLIFNEMNLSLDPPLSHVLSRVLRDFLALEAWFTIPFLYGL